MISRIDTLVYTPQETYPEETPVHAVVGGPFPGVAISLVLTLIVAIVGGAVGLRFGWTWGLGAGLLAWVTTPVLLLICFYLAAGRTGD